MSASDSDSTRVEISEVVMRKKLDRPDDRIRIEFTRTLTLRRFPVAKGEAWDTSRDKIQDDGSIDVDGSIVNAGHWVEVATWRAGTAAPPKTATQVAAWKSVHEKEGAR